MFQVKICGVTRVADALAAVAAGADAIGLNFYPPSPRYVSPEAADEIAAAVRGRILLVGVFVNVPADTVRNICKRLSLGAVQLHGDEPPQAAAELADLHVIRAIRGGEQGLESAREVLAAIRRLGGEPRGALIDAAVPGSYGGTGQAADWEGLAALQGRLDGVPLILAGGLTPENVAAAISQARPSGVDTASGVETSPGVKSAERIEAFVRAARRTPGSPMPLTGKGGAD